MLNKYRVNYGNGQVGATQSLAACKRELAGVTTYMAFAYIQVNLGGEWFTYRRAD